ncbi:Maf family protein [Hydrogenoanaerobacterium sp.]|uniref:Maf family protein n=1 Tax=Hydrogenoanaerobacterium sp. TaxID=2953763 RepID=UPI002898DF5E|nr:Maf family protein [Hydrogenoanaerobacterium sp.]
MDVILASGSPRRRELLAHIHKDYQVIPANIDETIPQGTRPCDVGETIAKQKTLHVQQTRPNDLIIGADTVVVLHDEILGKPKDADDAKRMLQLLSGKEHQVYTGVSLRLGAKAASFTQCTKVWFYPLTEWEIDEYIATKEPFDKAGAYGIQGEGSVLVEKIEGDFFNVMGLPVARLKRELAAIMPQNKI